MSGEENKEIVRRFGGVWNAGHEHIVDELASPDLVVWYPLLPEEVHGPEAFKQVLAQLHASLPDVQVTVEDLIAEGDTAVARWSMRGTSRGAFAGIPPTGKQVEWTGITTYRVANGKIVEERGEEDALGLLQQLGAIPAPEEASAAAG
jgi:steroid delta-isomerase-like uncharacterized protein